MRLQILLTINRLLNQLKINEKEAVLFIIALISKINDFCMLTIYILAVSCTGCAFYFLMNNKTILITTSS